MTRDQVLARLKERRAEFDGRLHTIPGPALDRPIPGVAHSPKQILAHVSAYERLIVDRLRAARLGETTEFDRDRVGWEAFNDRIWGETAELPVDVVLARSAADFLALLEEVAGLADSERVGGRGAAEAIDPAWLQGRPLWEGIAVDGFDHYPAHFAQLEAATVAASE
jgi:hypothetical protein